jgi:hypothetical protein
MFQEIIQKLTDNHDQIITEFQEKIDSIESYYVLIAELISPTNIRLHIETEYDGGSIEGLCLKVMTIYVDNSETHSEDDIKTLIETELENAKEKLKQFVPQVSENTRLITEDQLEQIEYSQPTDLYYNALKKPAKTTQEAKIFSPNRFSTYFEEN